jgi:hypothetical protein
MRWSGWARSRAREQGGQGSVRTALPSAVPLALNLGRPCGGLAERAVQPQGSICSLPMSSWLSWSSTTTTAARSRSRSSNPVRGALSARHRLYHTPVFCSAVLTGGERFAAWRSGATRTAAAPTALALGR